MTFSDSFSHNSHEEDEEAHLQKGAPKAQKRFDGFIYWIDELCGSMGKWYGLIFKVFLPFLMSFPALDQSIAYITKNRPVMYCSYIVFLIALVFLPKVASIAEFIIHPFFWYLRLIYMPTSTTIGHILITMSMIFILFKLFFLVIIIIKDIRGEYGLFS